MSSPSPRAFAGLSACLIAAGVLFSAQALAQAPAKPAAPAPAAPAAAAPPAQAAGPQRVELVASQPEWTKVCGKVPETGKEVCYTTRDFGQAADQPPVLALAVYDVKGEDRRQVRLLLPLGLVMNKGFRIGVDKGEWSPGVYAICFPNGCFGESEVLGPFIANLKKGAALNVQVRNQGNVEVTFGIPLKDFGKAFDGAAIDPKVLEDQQKQLQEELQKRALEERKKLEQQGAAPVPGAPAAAVPVAPPKP